MASQKRPVAMVTGGTRGIGSGKVPIYLPSRTTDISFSVVNMTEKSQCCQLDLGYFF